MHMPIWTSPLNCGLKCLFAFMTPPTESLFNISNITHSQKNSQYPTLTPRPALSLLLCPSSGVCRNSHLPPNMLILKI